MDADHEHLQLPSRTQAQAIIEVIVTLLIMVFAIFGNSLVCLAVYRTRRLRTIPNAFIVNLSITDLLLVTTVLPVVAQTQITGAWYFGMAYCQFQAFQSIYLFAVSLFTLTCISINRYFKIVRRELYDTIFHKKSVVITILSVWIAAALLCMGPFFGWGGYQFDEQKALCSSDNSSGSFRTSATIVIIGNMVVIVVCNVLISVSVKQHRRQMQRRNRRAIIRPNPRVEPALPTRPVAVTGDNAAGHLSRDPRETRGEDVHIARTISLVVFLFFLAWSPNLLLDNLVLAGVKVPYEVRMFGVYAVFLDSVINPVIYGVKNRAFRQAFRNILRCRSAAVNWRKPTQRASKSKVNTSVCLFQRKMERSLWDPYGLWKQAGCQNNVRHWWFEGFSITWIIFSFPFVCKRKLRSS